jgi:hypothetical protein
MSDMNRETKMVSLWFGDDLRNDGVDGVRDHISEQLDTYAEQLPHWFVDITGLCFVCDEKVDWERLRSLYQGERQ